MAGWLPGLLPIENGLVFWASCCGLRVRALFSCMVWTRLLCIFSLSQPYRIRTHSRFTKEGSTAHRPSKWWSEVKLSPSVFRLRPQSCKQLPPRLPSWCWVCSGHFCKFKSLFFYPAVWDPPHLFLWPNQRRGLDFDMLTHNAVQCTVPLIAYEIFFFFFTLVCDYLPC